MTLSFNNENDKEEVNNLNISNTRFFNNSDVPGEPDVVTEENRNQRRFDRNTTDNYSASFKWQEPLQDSLSIGLEIDYRMNAMIQNRLTSDFDPVTQQYSDVNELLTNHLSSGTSTWNPQVSIQVNKSKFNGQIQLGTNITRFENEMLYVDGNVKFNKVYLLPSANGYVSYRISKSKSLFGHYNYDINYPAPREVLPFIDISNPLNTIIGNPEIDPSTSQYGYLSYQNYDYATKSGYSIYAGGYYYDDQIVSFVTYDDSRRATTTYENVSGNYYGWFGGNWNKSKKREAHSYKYGVGLTAYFNRSQGFIEGEMYESNSIGLTPKINFTYDYGELLSIHPTYSLAFDNTNYTNFVEDEISNVVHKFNLQTTTYWPKNLVFGNDFGYTYNSNIANGFKKDFYLWNTSLGYNFFKEKLLAKVKVYDVLNQNQSATRTISATNIRDEQNIVLQQYVMFSLTYKLEKFGGKKKSDNMWFVD
jgi:hypothetical protein